jgi:hypothetical protein
MGRQGKLGDSGTYVNHLNNMLSSCQPVITKSWNRPEFVESYIAYRSARGTRVGDVKPPVVMTREAYDLI